MATKNPRQMISLEKPLFDWIKKNAQQHDLSVSMQIREYLKEIYALHEEKYWSAEGEQRLKTLNKKKTLTHEQIWK